MQWIWEWGHCQTHLVFHSFYSGWFSSSSWDWLVVLKACIVLIIYLTLSLATMRKQPPCALLCRYIIRHFIFIFEMLRLFKKNLSLIWAPSWERIGLFIDAEVRIGFRERSSGCSGNTEPHLGRWCCRMKMTYRTTSWWRWFMWRFLTLHSFHHGDIARRL